MSPLIPLLLVLLSASSDAASPRMGGLTPIADAGTNEQMQELGRFAVQEYNERREDGSSPPLTFSAVASAKCQVVAGIKYYLEVAAVVDGARRVFNAVVVVHPDQSRELESFEPVED